MHPSKSLVADVLLALVICTFGWATMFGWTWTPYFVYDDSYITLANATSLLTGITPFSSPALTGSTSIVHTLLASVLSLFAAPEAALALSNSLALCLAAIGMSKVCRFHGFSQLTTAAMTVAYACCGLTLMHAHNGLETSLVLAGSVWAIYFTETDDVTGSAIIAGLLPWIRPELSLLSLYCLTTISNDFTKRKLYGWLLIAATATMPFLAITFLNTGTVIPQTMAGKLAWFSEDCANRAWKIATTKSTISAYIKNIGLVFIGIAGLLISKSRKSYILLIGILVFYVSYYALFPGALGHYNLRYQYFCYTPLFYGLIILTTKAQKPQKIAPILAVALTAQITTIDIPINIQTNKNNKTFTEQSIAPIAEWINHKIPSDATILIHDAGYIGYKSQRHLIDLVGLKTPSAIKINQEINHRSCGLNRGAAIRKIVATHSPEYIVTLDSWDGIFGITNALNGPGAGYHLTTVFATKNGYSIYKIDNN